MTAQAFCYWLQGYFEISKSDGTDVKLNSDQIEAVQKHLNMVFAHDIDPKAGDPAVQASLNDIHESIIRC